MKQSTQYIAMIGASVFFLMLFIFFMAAAFIGESHAATFIDVGALNTATYTSHKSSCVAVNNDGVAACNSVENKTVKIGRFKKNFQLNLAFTYNGQINMLPLLTGYNNAVVVDINNVGVIVGTSSNNLFGGTVTTWDMNGISNLGAGYPIKINDQGQIITSTQVYQDGQWVGPDYFMQVETLDDNGVIGGWANINGDEGLWLTNLPVDSDSLLTKLSLNQINDGNMFGTYVGQLNTTNKMAMKYDANGWVTLSGINDDSVALAINSRGVAVGSFNGVAVKWRPDNRRVDLNKFVAGTGYILKSANGINDSNVIVGDCLTPDGQQHGFILVP